MSTLVTEQFQNVFAFIQQQVVTPYAWEDLAAATQERYDMLLQGYGTYVAVLPQLCTHLAGGDLRRSLPVTAAWILCDLSSDIFDDLQDGDGKERIWNRWKPGLSMSVGLGLLFTAQGCLAHADIPDGVRGEIIRRWADTGLYAARAQYTESHVPPTMHQYFAQLVAKSGTIFSTAAWAGACAGGASPTALQAILDFGLALGILIQLRDDCLDILSRSLLGDLRRGVFTLPVLYGLEQEKHPQHSQLVALCQFRDTMTEQQAATVVEILDEMQALPFALSVADAYRAKALSALSHFDRERSRDLRAYTQHLYTSISTRAGDAAPEERLFMGTHLHGEAS